MTHNLEKLLRRARALDKKALVEIYDLYSDALYAYAYKQVGQAQAAEDLVSETFFRFLRALERGGGPKDHLKVYLYRITHNLITDLFRREPPPSLELDEERLADDKPDPSRVVSSRQETERVWQALRLITAEQRQVVVLRFLEGWSTPEVASGMKNSIGAVKALQYRGLITLERILESWEAKPEPKQREISGK